jgi:flavodoxin
VKTLIVYDSVFGNTKRIAEAIAEGAGNGGDVTVVSAAEAAAVVAAKPDLLLVGGPTQRHGVSPNLAAFLDRLPRRSLPKVRAATFDTRYRMSAFLTGSAAKRATGSLRRAGCALIAPPESFFVERDIPPKGEKRRHEGESLEAGELERAREWGRRLAAETAADGTLNVDRR